MNKKELILFEKSINKVCNLSDYHAPHPPTCINFVSSTWAAKIFLNHPFVEKALGTRLSHSAFLRNYVMRISCFHDNQDLLSHYIFNYTKARFRDNSCTIYIINKISVYFLITHWVSSFIYNIQRVLTPCLIRYVQIQNITFKIILFIKTISLL